MLRAALDGADCSLELASNNSNNLSQGITFLVWLTGLFTPREYSTATSRALYKAIEEVERVQAARKARENSASSTDAEAAMPSAESDEGELGTPGGNNPGVDPNPSEDQEDPLGKDEAA